MLGELNGNRSPRKSTDRIPRTIKSRQEETLHRQNGHTDKLPVDNLSSNKRIVKSKDTKSTESNDKEQHETKREEKSCIPTARKLATSTLIPRSARALTSTGRPHNT